jgi:hypothetical protein
VNILGAGRRDNLAGMEPYKLHSLRMYGLTAMIMIVAALAAWAGWGSPSGFSLVWVAAVGAGLVIATMVAVRNGSPTRSVAHVLYDVEHPVGDTKSAAGGATR